MAIPVSSNLERRGMQLFVCKRCGGHEDDLHVLASCPFALGVWDLAPFQSWPYASIPSTNVLFTEANKLISFPPVGLRVPLWPWICWNLWKARNKLYFDGHVLAGSEVILKAIKDAREWQDAQIDGDIPCVASSVRPQARRIARTPPPLQGISCHVDAAWNPISGVCGIGGVFHDHNNTSRTSLPANINFSRRFITSALVAEAIAIRSAVMMAASSNIRSLTVLSDSQVLISMVKAKESRPALFGIMFDFYHFSLLFESITFVYVPRLENIEIHGK